MDKMAGKLRWGLLATGNIAHAFAKGLDGSQTGVLAAVGSRSRQGADKFGDEFGVSRRHASYQALLDDDQVDAVYISTPHPMHAEWAIKAAEAGKHILCEKPIALNHAEAMAVVEAARRHDVFLMEAFMCRCHPQTAKLIELLRDGTIGEVRLIQATFSFQAGFNPDSRLFANSLGGGGILDVGCYCTSLARLVAGVAAGSDFAEPVDVKGTAFIGPTSRVDEYAVASLKFPGGILASLATGVNLRSDSVVRIFGSEGHIYIPSPWIPAREGGQTKIMIARHDETKPREIAIDSPVGLYTIEADTVARHIEARQAPPPAMTWNDTLGNMKTLDTWREAIGMVYDAEKPQAQTQTVHKRPLAPRKDHNMKYGRVPGVEVPISRLIVGCDNQTTMPHAAVMFDDFIERGGSCFDTAHIYAGGLCERLLGQWIVNRNIRSKIAIIGKGAHTPHCFPEAVTQQLSESLERLQTDYVDVYLLHRDNPDVPVGEFVDVLNDHKKAGRIRAFGGSNWTMERLDAANAYADSKGLTGFTVVSNNFSLARMVEPPWDGCLASSDKTWRDWLARTQMTLMSWSSQARGFFAGTADPDNLSDPELVRCWYCEDNFGRLQRAVELAKDRGVRPINIALAYVLCQPFPTFALIGPRALSETRTSLPGMDVKLKPDELRWLNLER